MIVVNVFDRLLSVLFNGNYSNRVLQLSIEGMLYLNK